MYNIASAVTCRTLAIVRSLTLPGCGVTGALKPTQADQCLNLHFSFTMQLLHQRTFQTNYKFSPCPYNRLTIHFIPLICKRHRSHTLSQTFTLATFNFSPHPINQHLTPVFCALKNIFQLQQDFKCMFSFECR